ncbi:RAD52 family DNA repair protein [Falsirhodobacter sp. 20TX0035]|uniref:RAD52 family DNA repair protein n=1 Tax=Falsirhodobacter sp. 20TX0035 TaxID=3022019 RepID=UPI00232CA8F4|nr:RAD52 family DNA repair protein [Falsirhodobacter sp. 20TX0035]MDB6454742.1 RAD52 family DNA repair protein [Falsirhodobacter sp. 20TX0035]
MNWEKASAELTRKLDPAHVKQRTQGGSGVSYVEGWHAIAEMNRIFGFGAWDRQTVDIRQLGEPRDVSGKIRVDYMARVRVTVTLADGRTVTRDGCGFGQGIDRDVGQAHESALKEAETDAMKRAMMTFGNPFGLALYDKSRENVGVDAPPVNVAAISERLMAGIAKRKTKQDLSEYFAAEREAREALHRADPAAYEQIKAAFKAAGEAAIDDPARQSPDSYNEAA